MGIDGLQCTAGPPVKDHAVEPTCVERDMLCPLMTMSAGLVASQRIGTDTGCNDNAIKAVVVRLKGDQDSTHGEMTKAKH